MKFSKTFIGALALLSSTAVLAEQVYTQPKIVVTASRTEQSREDVIPSVSVITREDILRLQPNSALDLLNLQKGIDVARTGGIGGSTSVFLRGTNSNHTLVLIDGVRASSNVTGSFAWEHLPVSQIERIEIVRGSRVSLYGADAIGGVINIITRKQDNFYIRATSGSFDTHNFDLGYGNSTENGDYSVVIGSQKSDGFSATNPANAFSYNPDDDGYENLSLNFRSNFKIAENDFSFSFLNFKGDADFDSFFNVGNSDSESRIIRLGIKNNILNNWQSEVSISSSQSELSTKAFSNGSESDRLVFEWLMNKQFQNQSLGFGLNHRKDDVVLTHTVVDELNYQQEINNSAAFINWLAIFNKNSLTASLRFDDNNTYGSDTSADLGWAYQVNESSKINASVGTAFKAPNLIDLFSPFFQAIAFSPELNDFTSFFSFEGNPNLKPEESINYELGFSTKWENNQSFDVDLFYYDIDNLVSYQGATFKPINVLESTVKGIELEYNLTLDTLNLNINATIQDTKNEQTGESLLRRPDNKINLNVDKYLNKFTLGSSVRYASDSKDFGAELDSYIVLDLRASYQISPNWRLALKLENVTDEDYQLVNGYNTPKSSGFITVEWQNK